MKILTYSPSVEAYVEVSKKGGDKEYYDLSRDITSARVTRNSNTYSSFDITLQNKNRKYNGIFSPMDKITIYATKNDRHRVLTGYITTVDRFTLYPADFRISGKCTFYQLMQMYWDPALNGSWQLLAGERSESSTWRGYGNVIWKLLNAVGGWPVDRVKVGEMPEEVLDWAYRMYQAKMSDIEQARDMVNEFYEVLRTSDQFAGGSSGTTPGYNGTASVEAVEAAVKWMISVANDDSHGYDQVPGGNGRISRMFDPDVDCSSFIYYALLNNGWTQDQLGGPYPFATTGMISVLSRCGWTAYDYDGGPSKLKRGDIMLNPDTHTEMYIGGNQTVGAHWDYDWKVGDGSGNEVSIVTIATNWQKYLRYTG